MFVERFTHFMNLWTVYTDFLSGRYVPRVGDKDDESATGMYATLMFVLYARVPHSLGLNLAPVLREIRSGPKGGK